MAETKEFMVSCGTGKIPARLPAERTLVPSGPPLSATPLADAAASFRQALANPVGMPPLEKLVGKGAKVTIGSGDVSGTQAISLAIATPQRWFSQRRTIRPSAQKYSTHPPSSIRQISLNFATSLCLQ